MENNGKHEPTVNEVFEMYMSAKNNRLSDNSKYRYERMYNKHIRDKIGDLQVSKVRYVDMLKLYDELSGKLACGSIKFINSVLHSVFRMAQRDQLISFNPCDFMGREIKPNKKVRPKIQVLSEEEQSDFLKYVKKSSEYKILYPTFVVMFGTGLRSGEIGALCWEDIDFKGKKIQVGNNLIYNSVTCNEEITTPKSIKGMRVIPMVREVELVLKKVRREQGNTTGVVFKQPDGRLYVHNFLNKRIKSIVEMHNRQYPYNPLPDFTCHVIRKTFCSRLCEQNINLKVLQELMGHANIQTTLNIYAKIGKKRKLQSLDDFEVF